VRFESKGRFTDYFPRIPTFVITVPDLALVGESRLLARKSREE
jgi:glucokinase